MEAGNRASLFEGIRFFNDGAFFRCHEVLEEAWATEREPHRLFLQALIHVAVGLYHHQRGNAVGAVRQLKKAVIKLNPYLPAFEGVNTARLRQDTLAAWNSIETGELIPVYPRIHLSADEES